MSDVRRVEELLDRLAEERQGGAKLRRTVSLLLVAMVGVFVLNIWWQISTFDADELLSSLELQATTSVWPGLRDELQAVGEEALPAISQALADEAGVLLTRVTELLGTESETFQTNIGQHMARSLEAAFVDASSEQDPALEGRLSEFSTNPDVRDELLRRLQGASRQWAERQLDTTFAEHVALLHSINETVQDLVRQAEGSEATQGQTPDDVLLLFMEIVNSRLGGEG
jgi:hypothetical protein